jgi:pilus assembly protein CpaB
MAIRTDDPAAQTPKDGRKRKAPVRGIALLLLALFAALGAALLLTRYMDARVAAARVPTTKIVVAAVDIPVAEPIQRDWLKAVDWPAAARPEGAAADPAAIAGRVAMVPIARGEAVLPSKLVMAGPRSGLATIVPEGMRALAVKVDEVVGVAGFVHPGDHVDVIVTMKPRDDGSTPYVSRIVLQNVQVLAVGKDIELRGKEAKEAKPVTVATLLVSSEESERLALSTDRGHILLALRGIGDEELSDTRGITPPVMLLTSAPEPPKPPPAVATRVRTRREIPARQQPPPPVAAKPPREKQMVEVIRGDLYERRAFETQERQP